MQDVTQILKAVNAGEPEAADRLLRVVYNELRQLAAAKMACESPGQTLQPTALVHEAWLRLGGDEHTEWKGRAHFFGAAAEAMRRILIDAARRKNAVRHGGQWERVNLESLELVATLDDTQVLDLDEALARFVVHDPVKAELVKLRFFVGLTLEQAAQSLGISEATAKRYWAYARAWLYREICRARTRS